MKKTLIQRAILAMGGNFTNDTLNSLSADTLNSLSADTLNNLSADTLKNLSADTLNSLSADTLNSLSADTLKNLSADTLNSLSAYTLNSLSAYTLNSLSADTLKNLSADTLKKIEKIWAEVPLVEKPYSTLNDDIKAKRRVHEQSQWGPDYDPKENLCGTQMCTAGHLVNMGGADGYKLKNKYGWEKAAAMIHIKAHPDMPTQNFGSIPQADAIAYIELAAEFEKREDKGQTFDVWIKTKLEA
jgi:hypothetical protein